ncbi:MAG: leucine dehydrogenase [Candidatus Doudnabacteria bacterium]|nr:leucine dehydrogenase [Candidatus Doudnabacteria bacterium]
MSGKLPTKPKLIVDLSKSSKLNGYIVIYNDNLGPALGGTRIADYNSEKDALTDALKLAEAMTYKSAIAGLPFGGGKGVIINKPGTPRGEVLKEYASQVNKLKGEFYTGEDVGLEEPDVQFMLKFSPYFIGKTGEAGDPSYFAALSAFNSIKVSLNFIYKSDKIEGRTFAIKGVGKTGNFLAKLLSHAGGRIFVIDPDPKRVMHLMATTKNVYEAKGNIEEMDVDVFCPCAMGNDITKSNVNKIKAKIVAGTANNQLESREIGDELFKRGILKVPDYVANAGGLLDVADELMPGGYNRKRVLNGIDGLKDKLLRIFKLSKKEKISPSRVADAFAEKVFLKKKETQNVAHKR